MIFLVNGTNRAQFAADLAQMHRHRKTVFVDRAGWKVPVVADQEVDGYDCEDTIYLLGKSEPEGPLLASVRLLPTMRPHLIADLFAAACRGGPPRGATIWEVSRFCTTPELPNRGVRLALLWEIVCGITETALLCGIDQVIFAANRALLPLAMNCGWEARKLGESLRDGDDQVTAVAADISTEGLRQVRERHGVPVPVLRFHASTVVCAPYRVASSPPADGAQTLHHSTRAIGRTGHGPFSLGEHTVAESTLLSRTCDTGIPARTIGAATIPDLLRSNSYVIFDGLLPEDTVERISEELEPSFTATECGQGDLSGQNTRIGSVLQKSPTSRAVAVHPIMLCVANAILGAHCELFQLCLTQGVRTHPGQWQRVPHRDDEPWQSNRRGIEYLVNVMWALSDFTAENGAPMLRPRSHFDRSSSNLEPMESVVAEMRRGSALVYLGSIMHCGRANLSREPLSGLHFSYCLGWLKQYGNSFDSYPPNVTKEFPEMLRELLGFYDHGPNLRSSKGQDSSVPFDFDSRAPASADEVPTAIARELDLSRADGQCDTLAGPRTKQ